MTSAVFPVPVGVPLGGGPQVEPLPPPELAALEADAPVFIARNALWDAPSDPKWTIGGTLLSIDWTAAPTSNLFDGRCHISSHSQAQPVTTYYLVGTLDDATIDCIAVKPTDVRLPYTQVRFQIGANQNFAPFATVATWHNVVGSSRFASFLLAGGMRFHRVNYWRLFFISGNAVEPPRIGEVVLGRRRQLSRKFDIPYDDQPSGSDVTEFVSRSRARTRYVLSRGFRDIEATFSPTGHDQFGLDDVATWRTVYRESEQATRPIVYCENPGSAPSDFLVGFLGKQHQMPLQGPYERRARFDFTEIPPFLEMER